MKAWADMRVVDSAKKHDHARKIMLQNEQNLMNSQHKSARMKKSGRKKLIRKESFLALATLWRVTCSTDSRTLTESEPAAPLRFAWLRLTSWLAQNCSHPRTPCRVIYISLLPINSLGSLPLHPPNHVGPSLRGSVHLLWPTFFNLHSLSLSVFWFYFTGFYVRIIYAWRDAKLFHIFHRPETSCKF